MLHPELLPAAVPAWEPAISVHLLPICHYLVPPLLVELHLAWVKLFIVDCPKNVESLVGLVNGC